MTQNCGSVKMNQFLYGYTGGNNAKKITKMKAILDSNKHKSKTSQNNQSNVTFTIITS